MLMEMTGINWTKATLADGNIRYYYFVFRGGPKFWTRDHTPEPTPYKGDFVAAYEKAKRESKIVGEVRTMADLIIDFKTNNPDPEYERYYPEIKKKFGTAKLSAFENPKMRRHIKNWHKSFKVTPRKADYILTTLVRLLNYAVDDALMGSHCAHKIARLYSSDRAKIIWEDTEIDLLCSLAHDTMRFTILLSRYAGLRRGDLISITRSADKGSHLQWWTSKSRKRIEIIVPLVPKARQLLDEIQAYRKEKNITATTIVFNQRGMPWTKSGISTSFGKERDKHETLNKRLHDIRGSAITEFRKAGVSLQDIAEIFGWTEESVRQIIRKYVDREAIVSATIHKLQKSKNA